MATRWLSAGEIVTGSTGLAPFWSDSRDYWTSDSARHISTFRYTYSDFVGAAGDAEVKSRVAAKYGFGSARKKRNVLHTHRFQLSSRSSAYYDWTVRIRFKACDLRRPFAVHVFLATPTNGTMQDSSYVGSAFSFTKRSSNTSCAPQENFVQLSKVLLDSGGAPQLDPVEITPLLTEKLSWKITEVCLDMCTQGCN